MESHLEFMKELSWGSSDGSSDGSNELVLGSDEGIISFQLNISRQFPAPCTEDEYVQV